LLYAVARRKIPSSYSSEDVLIRESTLRVQYSQGAVLKVFKVTPSETNCRSELEVALLESENARQESEFLREMVAKLLADYTTESD